MPGVRQVQVIAHRGASGYLPEHTLPSKAMAYAMGADYLEQDLVLTNDDVPIVLHDIHLDTVTDVATQFPDRKRDDGRYYAIDFSIAEIKQLRAGERFDQKSGKAVFPNRFPVGHGSFQIPTLVEEIELVQGLNQSTGRSVGIYPELKQPEFHHKAGKDLASIVLNILKDYAYSKRHDHICLQCFDEQELQRVRQELKSDLTLIQLLSAADWMSQSELANERRQHLDNIAHYANGIGPNVNGVFRQDPLGGLPIATDLVAAAHERKLVIHPWTYRADDLPPLFDSFADLHRATVLAGIDGLFSDFPDQSVELLTTFAESP